MGFDKEASWEAVCLHGGDTTMQVEWLQQNQVLLWDFNELPVCNERRVACTSSRRGALS